MRQLIIVGCAIVLLAGAAWFVSQQRAGSPNPVETASRPTPPAPSALPASEAPPPPAPDLSSLPVPSRPAMKQASARVPSPEAAAQPGRLVPGRLLARSAQIPPEGVGGYGVVALRAKPTAASKDRLMAMCRSFVAHFAPNEQFPDSIPMADRMLTIWPYEGAPADAAQGDDCEYLTEHYDLVSGMAAIEDAAYQGMNLQGQGPFLIGWSPSDSRRAKDKIVLIVDLSHMDSAASFDEAFDFWQRKIVEDPSLWRSGWSVTGLKLALRDYIDKNASSLLSAIKFTGMGN